MVLGKIISPVGYCRGSVGGSVVAYLSDIIDVDPVWNTMFSRFCNEHRVEVGDIEWIFHQTKGHWYISISLRFGVENTAIFFSGLQSKGAIDDIVH